MRDRKAHAFALGIFAGEGGLRFLHHQVDFAADEFQTGIAHQRAGQQPRFGQHLKAVADAQHRPPLSALRFDSRHDVRMAAMAPQRR